jgi:hypothetical protein
MTDALSGRRAWWAAWLALTPWAVVRAGSLSDSDTFWQIRTGVLIMERRALPTTDPFSWTAHGRPWTLNSWGFDVLVGIVHALSGLVGVALLGLVLVMLVGGLVLLLCHRLGAAPLPAGLLVLLGLPFLTAYMTVRPQLVDYLAVLGLVLLLHRIAAGQRPILAVTAVGVLSALWVNLHAGALLGVAIAGCCSLLLLLRRVSRREGWWCLLAAAAAAAGALVNPRGLGIVSQTLEVRQASLDIVEWQPLDVTRPLDVVQLAVGAVALVLAVRRRDLVLVGALAVTGAGALAAGRLLPVVFLLALPVLASAPALSSYARSRQRLLGTGAALTVAAFGVLALGSLGHVGRPNPRTYPAATVAAVPHGCHVYNDYSLGGYLILQRPDLRVSLDSRNDVYGLTRLAAAQRTLRGEGDVRAELAGADCVLVPPATGLAHRLRGAEEWTVRSTAPGAVLFVRARGGTDA